MHVAQIWRHPVKSLQGEALEAAEFEADGLAGDRAWGIVDRATGKVLTARREPRLLLAAAALADGSPTITLPDGQRLKGPGTSTDAALSAWLGNEVTLTRAADVPAASAEAFADSTDDASPMWDWTMPAGRFVDAFALLVLTTASLRAGAQLHPDGVWDVRRFRPNILIDVDEDEGFVEDGWAGRVVHAGDIALDVVMGCPRCTMVTRPQPGLDRDVDVFKTLAREHNSTFGMWATVRVPGELRAGSPVRVAPA